MKAKRSIRRIYNAVASGYLAVYDNYAYATTSYARSGSDIGVGASIDATYRYGGKNNVLNDVDTSSGGGATARVDISVNEQPTAAFLHVRGVHQVSVSQLPSGYWMDITEWNLSYNSKLDLSDRLCQQGNAGHLCRKL